MVTVRKGVNEMSLNLEGKTVAEVKDMVFSLLNLSGDEQIFLNEEVAHLEDVLQDGDVVEFKQEDSKKGGSF